MTKSAHGRFGAGLKKIPVILWGLIAILIVLGIVSPNSVHPAHLLNFTRQAAPMIVVSIGQMIVMIIGGLDLSVAANMILVDVIANQMMMNNPSRAVPVALFCLLVGTLIGLLNGYLCAVLKMPSFVVTLGMSTLLLGITMIYCGGAPKGAIPDNFRALGTGFVGKIPTAAFVWLTIAVIVILVFRFFPIGRYIYATGINAEAAYQAGLPHTKIKVLCYALCGFFAAIAGLQVAAYIGTASLQLGEDYQTKSIAVALLGGASFSGGKGSVGGIILASMFMVVMSSLISVLNMGAGDQKIIEGAIILVGLVLNGLRGRRE